MGEGLPGQHMARGENEEAQGVRRHKEDEVKQHKGEEVRRRKEEEAFVCDSKLLSQGGHKLTWYAGDEAHNRPQVCHECTGPGMSYTGNTKPETRNWNPKPCRFVRSAQD
jgi:hypothetical protein